MNRLCKKTHKNLTAFIDNELSQPAAEAVKRHIAACPLCRKEHAGLLDAVSRCAEWEPIAPSPDFDRAFQTKLRAARAEQRKPWESRLDRLRQQWSVPRLTLAAAAVCAAIIVCASVMTYKTVPYVSQEKLHIATDMELFLNLEVIENSEALENFEVITLLDVFEEELQG